MVVLMNTSPKQKRYSDLPVMDKVNVIADWLKEHKAGELTILDLRERSTFTDVMLVATATSVRHAQSLADGVNKLCGENSYEYLGMDGYNVGKWILVDCNDFIVHIFQEDTRSQYDLERLWSNPKGKAGMQAMAEEIVEE